MSRNVSSRARSGNSTSSVDVEALRAKLEEAEETIRAIRHGEADAVVVQGPEGPRVYTLETADQSYRTLVEQMAEGALILSNDGMILYANRGMSTLIGEPALAGRSLVELTVPEDRPMIEQLLCRATRHETTVETKLLQTQGSGVPVQLSVNPLSSGSFTGIAAVVTDLTEQKRREKVSERERLTSTVLEFAGTAILVCDALGRVVRANREAVAICGEETVGRFLLDLLPIGVPFELLREWTSSQSLEVGFRRDSGDDRALIVSCRQLGSGAPQDGSWVVTLSDVTERKRTEVALKRAKEAAEAANRAKSDFLSVMSHELRTPLNSVIGYSDLLLLEVNGSLGEQQRSHVQRIQASARLQLSLIEEILTYARIEAGQEHLQLEPVNVMRLVEDVAELVRPEAVRKGLEFAVTCSADARLEMVTDGAKLRRVLINLAANATKFTRRGRIDIVADLEKDGRLALHVSDTGPGIPSDHLDDIWDPFTQVDPSPTRQSSGTGLGLAIVRRLVEFLGGDVAVTTEVGHGTTFTVRLPGDGRSSATSG